MPFGLKNAGATYQQTMVAIFHDMIHGYKENYVDDIVEKSWKVKDQLSHLRKLFERCHCYKLRMNPLKCAFGVPSSKLLGFMVFRKGIDVDPTKIKVIHAM